MLVTKIQRFSTHDGPGVRTVVFLSGCPLSCKWCHNPEAQLFHRDVLFISEACIGCGACVRVCPRFAHERNAEENHILNREKCIRCLKCTDVCPAGALTPTAYEMSTDEIIRIVRRDKAFYDSPDHEKPGGLTLSGGEPLTNSENALSLLRAAKSEGISTAVETSGYFNGEIIPSLVPLTDIFLWDFKDGNDIRHKKNTGVSGKTSRENLTAAGKLGASIILRCIMINGVNMDEDNLCGIADVYHAAGCIAAELLPYHPYGDSKYTQLGLNSGADAKYIPEKEQLGEFRKQLIRRGVNVKPMR